MMRVHIHVDRLVLHGVDYADRHSAVAAIERELTGRLGQPGAAEQLAGLGHRDRLPSGRVTIDAGSRRVILGAAAAGGVAQALVPGLARSGAS
jgi:hypothetical protein